MNWSDGTPRSTGNAFDIAERVIHEKLESKHERENRLDRASYLRRKLAGLLKPQRSIAILKQADADKTARN